MTTTTTRTATATMMATATMVAACSASPSAPGPRDKSGDASAETTFRMCYISVDGRQVHGTLVRQHAARSGGADSTAERLLGVTELAGRASARLVEDVTLDDMGWVRRAEAVRTIDGGQTTRVLFDPGRGSVDVTASAHHVHWDVPDDLPWIWAPLLTASATGGAVATAVEARVIWKAAAGGQAVRLLEVGALRSQTVTAAQVLVPDSGEAGVNRSERRAGGTVVLGDDAIDVEGGMPARLHLAALGTEVEPVDADGLSGSLVASSRCSSTGLTTP